MYKKEVRAQINENTAYGDTSLRKLLNEEKKRVMAEFEMKKKGSETLCKRSRGNLEERIMGVMKGEIETNIREIFPTMGVNKYIVINANGMENVRLVK